MLKERVLVVEDDKHIAKLVRYNLQKAGFDTVVAVNGEEALSVLGRESFHLVLLDIMLPKMDGFEVCRHIRQNDKLKNLPIIMLTAKGEEVDRVVGLELGADDYIVKPFSPRELILRIKAILRRGAKEEMKQDFFTSGPLHVDMDRYTVKVGQKDICLTPMEFKLLVILMRREGRVQTRDRLLTDVWGMHSDVYTRTVDTHIKRLREKLGKAGKMIETVVGMGYRFNGQDDED